MKVRAKFNIFDMNEIFISLLEETVGLSFDDLIPARAKLEDQVVECLSKFMHKDGTMTVEFDTTEKTAVVIPITN